MTQVAAAPAVKAKNKATKTFHRAKKPAPKGPSAEVDLFDFDL